MGSFLSVFLVYLSVGLLVYVYAGIVGLYLTLVISVGRFVRLYVLGLKVCT